jgi:hypothetical protein
VEAFGAHPDGGLQRVLTWRIEDGTFNMLTLSNIPTGRE